MVNESFSKEIIMPGLTQEQLTQLEYTFNTTVTAGDTASTTAFMNIMQEQNADFDDLAQATHMNRIYLIGSLQPAVGFMGVTQADLDEANAPNILTGINMKDGTSSETRAPAEVVMVNGVPTSGGWAF